MITAVVMVGSRGEPNTPVGWVDGARRAAAQDLLEQLSAQTQIDRVIVFSPSTDEFNRSRYSDFILSSDGPVHVGRSLAKAVEEHNIDRLLYFGGGSAPLMSDQLLSEIVDRLANSSEVVITNNRYASDWAAISPAGEIDRWVDRLPQDNMIGWVLANEAGLRVEDLPPSAASRLDIDTPSDLLILGIHSETKHHLRRFISGIDIDLAPLESLLEVLRTPASHIFATGRLGPDAWKALNRSTESWIRVLSEERGMISSGRYAKGEVYSILGSIIENQGLDRFMAMLTEQAHAALIDNRVLLAHRGQWPSKRDRFASDLGLVDRVGDPWLRQLTAAAMDAPIPIIMGGHGLLTGDLFAICEII